MFRLTDVDFEREFPELANRDLRIDELEESFNKNHDWIKDFNRDFVSWIFEAVKCGFFKTI